MTEPRRPDRSSRVNFRMWRSPQPLPNGAEYYATFTIPAGAKPGDVYAIDVRVVQAEPLAGEERGRRGFEGIARKAGESMLRGARVQGDPSAMPKEHRDLLTPLAEHPFDDKLPEASCAR